MWYSGQYSNGRSLDLGIESREEIFGSFFTIKNKGVSSHFTRGHEKITKRGRVGPAETLSEHDKKGGGSGKIDAIVAKYDADPKLAGRARIIFDKTF